MASETYPLFCMGNPLLDMQVRDGEALLKKYELKANDAILAGPEHYPMCVHLVFDLSSSSLLTQILPVMRMWSKIIKWHMLLGEQHRMLLGVLQCVCLSVFIIPLQQSWNFHLVVCTPAQIRCIYWMRGR